MLLLVVYQLSGHLHLHGTALADKERQTSLHTSILVETTCGLDTP